MEIAKDKITEEYEFYKKDMVLILKHKRNRLNNFIYRISIVLYFFCFVTFPALSQIELVQSQPGCEIWWAGSTYKIEQNESVPKKRGKVILRAAKNETESFQLILTPTKKLNDITVNVSDLENRQGDIISSENITIRNVEYVHVTKPSGKLHKKGWYPDPLPLYKTLLTADANINKPVWFTVKVPRDAVPGEYNAIVIFKSDSWQAIVPVKLNVWNFSLPELPYMRSGFGMSTSRIKQYHNLETKEELGLVTDKYFRSFKDYRISPYYFYDLAKIKKTVNGIDWTGGIFNPDITYEGRYSYQIEANRKGRFAELVSIDPTHQYLLKWQARTLPEEQTYTVVINCYDQDKQPIYWSMKWMKYKGSGDWRQDTMFIDTEGFFAEEDLPDYRPFSENARYASVHLYGPENGDVWFDDFKFIDVDSMKNILPEGNFEPNINELAVELDFSEFDIAAHKYLDEFGFSGFRMGVSGLAKRSTGIYNGFVSGTAEYKKLMGDYLLALQNHLEVNGWLGKEYLYWADEPAHEHYKFVREGMETIHEAAPKLTRFITENNPGPEIMDVTEIGCPVLYKVEPEKVKEWSEKGRKFWSYLMCWPKDPHVNLFIDSYAINMRMWLWISYKYGLEGILVWNSNQWNGAKGAAPDGMVQNIWEDPMTYKSGHGTPYGSAPEFGNGDGMFFYPPNRDPNHDKSKYMDGPIPSIRLEILREGLDDYDYMIMLEECIKRATPDQKTWVKKAERLLDFKSDVFVNDTIYTKDPQVLMKYRNQMGELLNDFYGAK